MPKQTSRRNEPLQDPDREDLFDHWKKGKTEFEFARDEIKDKAER